jgi:hypothetical protein
VLIYFIGWSLMLGGSIWWLVTGKYQPHFVVASLFYCCVIACFRGNTGTDTEMYQNMFAAFQLGNIQWQVEGGFALVGTVLLAVSPTPEIAVRLVSLLFFVIVAIYMRAASRDQQWIALSYLLPVFAYQYSMNGIRIGLASSVLLLCALLTSAPVNSRKVLGYVATATIHYSVLVSGGYILLAVAARQLSALIVGSLVLVGAAYVLVLFAGDYLVAKEQLYAVYLPPSELSGLSRLVLIAVLGIGVLCGKLDYGSKLVVLIPTFLFAGVAALIARDSFAGLRLLDLLTFSMPVAVGLVYRQRSIRLDLCFKSATLVAGIVGAFAVGRNFLSEAGEGPSPFIPFQWGVHLWL